MNQERKDSLFIFSDDYYKQLDNKSLNQDENALPNEQENFHFNSYSNNNSNNNSDNVGSVDNFGNINSTSFNNVSNTNEKSAQESFDFLNNQSSNDNRNVNNDKEKFLEPTNRDSILTTESNNKVEDEFNVTTGVNKDLEKEVLKSTIQANHQIPIVQNNVWLDNKSEKTVYRATRNNPINIRNFDDDEVAKEKTPPVYVEEVIPKIINIDEEIKKDKSLVSAEVYTKTYADEEDLSMLHVTKSNLLNELALKEQQTNKISILARYGDDFCSRDYVTNPAIGRSEEIKQLILILLTQEKSGILVGKPGIGKTSIVEGLAYLLQRNKVPDALKGYRIISVKTTSLLGTLPTGDTRLQTLIDELKDLDKVILFIDEIHMLMGATSDSSLDFANMFKESLGRGSIKMIGATTTDEYERYVLRDKAFVRRFQRVDVMEPDKEHTVRILIGTLPKIEKNTGAKLKYSDFIKVEIMTFIVDITSEYKRVYGIGSRYPDICLTLLSQAFSQAVFNNRNEVNILDIRNAIKNSKNIYQDVIDKELKNFDIKFKKLIMEETTTS